MNIWLISKYNSHPSYGPGCRLLHHAVNFKKYGHEPFLISSDANHTAKFPDTNKIYNYESINDVLICWIKTFKYTRTASFKRIISWLDFEFKLFTSKFKISKNPDVVIISSLSLLTIFYGVYLKTKFRCKLIFEVRDIWPLTMTEEGNFSKWHPLVLLLKYVEMFAYKKSDLIVGTMPKLDQHVFNIIGYKKPFFCSPLGFVSNNQKTLRNNQTNALEKDFPKGKIIFGYCGSMGISNALETYISCIKDLSEKNNIHFVFIGSGALKDKYEQILKDNNNVCFIPKISPEQVSGYLQLCDVLYLSTHNSKVWDYGQSMNKLVSYMLSAKPIIASYAGYPSMLNESNAGEFVKPNDKKLLLEKILHYATMTNEERNTLGAKGLSWITKNRNYNQLSEEYISRINEMVST